MRNPWNNRNGRPSRYRTKRDIAADKRKERERRTAGLVPVGEKAGQDHNPMANEIDVYINGQKVARGLRQLDGHIAWPDVWVKVNSNLQIVYGRLPYAMP